MMGSYLYHEPETEGTLIIRVLKKYYFIAMMTLETSPSHSWWWNSHNSPKNSKWLQLNLQELDEKVKEMLRLIEEDADSFAKRAEMYYQKRPELVNLVEEFYRAYRSLAERYDYLAGEIRQNIPKSLQVHFGLSGDSSNSVGYMGRQHHCSPLRNSHKTIAKLFNKAGETEDGVEDNLSLDKMQASEHTAVEDGGLRYQKLSNKAGETEGGVEDILSLDKMRTPDRITPEHGGLSCLSMDHSSGNGHSDCALDLCTEQGTSSNFEAENLMPIAKLQQGIENLEVETKLLTDSSPRKVLKLSYALKVESLEDQCKSMQESKSEVVPDEIDPFSQRRKMQAGLMAMISKGVQDSSYIDDSHNASRLEGLDMDSSAENHGGSGNQSQDCLLNMDDQMYVSMLHRSMSVLIEENKVLKQAILERGEEKREAIRQLCLSIDMLKHENKHLLALLLTKRRLHPLCPAWMKFLCLGD